MMKKKMVNNNPIPKKLRVREFKFVKLLPKEKKPFEKNWGNSANYEFDNPELLQHIANGGNVGILTGVGNLVVLDIDNQEVSDSTDFDTFTVKTGSSKKHFYFSVIEEMDSKKIKDIGDLRGKKTQVVIPQSIHPSGQPYVVLKDVPIKQISKAELESLLQRLRAETSSAKETIKESDRTRSGIEYKKVINLIGKGKTKEEIFSIMSTSEKWSTAHPQYRELTYSKALAFVENSKQKKLDSDEEKKRKEEELRNRIEDDFENAKQGMTDAEVRSEIEYLLGNLKTKAAIYLLAIHLLTKYRLITIEDTQEIFVYKEGVYYGRADRLLSAHAQHILTDLGSTHFISETLAHIKRSTYKKREDLLEPLLKVCLQNGILNLEIMQLEPHTPDIVFFNKLPISFISTADCPLIKKFLKEVLPTNDDILSIQELFGYCLYKEYLIHKAFMFVGGGSNGKSTLIKILKHFLGKENCAAVPLHQIEGDKFAVASLFGKLANMFADLPAKALKDSSLFKMLTGEDNIPAEKKFKDKFFFQNYSKMIFSANQIPKTPDESDAFFRRWIILQFPNQFTGSSDDKKLIYRLTTDAEMSGLLNYAIEGLKRLLEKGDFTSAKSIEEMREVYMRQSDSVMSFIMDCLEVSISDHIGKKELYTRYTEYCREKIYPIVPENTFHQELHKKIRVEDYRPAVKDPVTNNFIRVNCWRGIKLIQNRLDSLDSQDTIQNSSPGSQGSQGNSDNNTLGAWINSDEEPEYETELD